MTAAELADLLGKECVVIESGRGTVALARAFRVDESRVYADLETTHSTMLQMNRMRMNGEPAVAGWQDVFDRVGKQFTIFQPKEYVRRGPRAYLHFSSPYGGTRLLFLDEYVDKVRRKDDSGWEWDEMLEKARVEP